MKKRNKIFLLITILMLSIFIINKTFGQLKAVPKVTFKSKNLSYDEKAPGSFQIEKSAKWIGINKALIRFDVTSVLKEKNKYKDVIFVLDESGSMSGEKINKLKEDAVTFTKALMTNPKNRVALVTFDTDARLISKLTSDKDLILSKITEMTDKDMTNYNDGLLKAEEILEGYQKEADREIVLLFLTDGYPNTDTPNEEATYKRIKEKHPYLNVNAVQYEMGEVIQEPIKKISEKQFHADMDKLNNILFEAGATPVPYDKFVITDYLSKHFEQGNVSKIKTSMGKASLEGDKITWDIEEYKTGMHAYMEIEVDLKSGEDEEFYPTNSKTEIDTKLEDKEDRRTEIETPVLKGKYKVIYEGNAAGGCSVTNIEATKEYKAYEKVKITDLLPKCQNHSFAGYEIITKVKKLNEDYFEMPEEDVIIRATWTRFSLNKRMDGEVAKAYTLYNHLKDQSLGNDKALGIDYSKVNSPTNGEGVYLFDETKADENPVYFYRGTHNLNNNLIYADFCWKVVRTTETGGVRLVYNGTPVNGECQTTTGAATQIGTSAFNGSYNHKKYVGYMYGEDDAPYENKYDSTIKKYIDTWYEANIKNKGQETLLDKESTYCGDRSNEYLDGVDIRYQPYKRHFKDHSPSLKCEVNDSYGVEGGNKALRYPVGLLSSDEALIAGGLVGVNSNYYLYTNKYYWLLSPSNFDSSGGAGVLLVDSYGRVGSYYVDYAGGVRPAVTLAPSTSLVGGDGSKEAPFLVS